MSKKVDVFDDKTILSTPNPIHSSSMSQSGRSKSSDGFLRVRNDEMSFGTKSKERSSDAGERWRRERLLASSALNRIDSIEKINEGKLLGLPSRFLRPSEVSTCNSGNFLNSESTINESDLLMPGNSSTPRESMLSNLEYIMKAPLRQSMGSSISQLASSVKDNSYDLNDFMENFRKTMNVNLTGDSFCSAEKALQQFEKDEMSWKQKKDIPVQLNDFSVVLPHCDDKQLSMGSFFRQRSDNLSTVLAKSPEKVHPPVPLIETSVTNVSVNELDSDSFSVSAIARILSETKQTPTKATNYFLNTKKKSDIPSYRNSFPYDENEHTREQDCRKSDVKTLDKPENTNRQKSSSSAYCESTTLELCEEGRNKTNSNIPSHRNSLSYDENEDTREKNCRKSDVTTLDNTENKNRQKSSNSTSYCKSPTLELCEEGTNENFKENVSPDFHQENSFLSLGSSSSLSNLPNGKLPIATTKTEIIWGCTKPGKNVSQDFVIKNKSMRRIGIVCTVSNPSFRLIKEGVEINFSSTIKLNLHPYETRNLTVTFAPTTVGAAIDCLQFSPVDLSLQQKVKQHVKLFGYGGYGNVVINNIIKDTSGKFLLSLGNIDNVEAMSKKFILKNIGTLPSFAHIVFVSSGLHLFSSLKVTPQVSVLLPGEEREIAVTYNPRKDDINFIQAKHNSVVDMGKLAVISGTEADRGRLRRLYKKGIEKGLPIEETVEKLVEKFPGEVLPSDLKQLKESVQSMGQILRLMNTTEIVITLEQDLDRSVAGFQNETAMFHSLCENTTLEYTVRTDSCNIEPLKIILKPPNKISDMIFITNNNQKQIYFEIYSKPEGLRLDPKDGTIDPGECLIVHVTCRKKCDQMCSFKVKVLADSESFDVDVKVVF